MKIEFDHVHLNSADVGAAVDFYVNVFGGEKTAEAEIAGTKMVVVEFGGVRFLINDKAPTGGPAGTSVDHIGFRVDDMEAAAAELKSRGAEFMLEPMEIAPGVTVAFVMGPDGIMIELSKGG
jgi:catechol 2,3-dioxygenase-like lactoylglutathione lyase family enzyme